MTTTTFKVVALNRIHEDWGDTGESFLVEAHVEVQCEGQPGGEAFRVTVASPQMLVAEMKGRSALEPGRGYLFANDFDEQAVISWLQRLVSRCDSGTWDSLRSTVERYFDWIE